MEDSGVCIFLILTIKRKMKLPLFNRTKPEYIGLDDGITTAEYECECGSIKFGLPLYLAFIFPWLCMALIVVFYGKNFFRKLA